MGRIAEITGRPDGFVRMLDMTAALETGAPSDVSDEVIATEKGWTLFSLDLDRDEAVFVWADPDIDLARAPFCYQAQYHNARRMLRMPLDTMIHLSGSVAAGAPPVHLFNIGHCGSTLLHHVFNRSGVARCLSEPLFTMNLAMQRDALGSDRVQALLQAGLRMLRLYPGHRPDMRLVVKHFSQANPIMAEVDAAEPGATHLYMYRRAEDWANSVNGFYHRVGGRQWLDADGLALCWGILSAGAPLSDLDGLVDTKALPVALECLSAVAWSRHMADHAHAVASDMTFYNFRYDELVEDRAAVLERIFDACGLPRGAIAPGLGAFDEDSHQGTATQHDRKIPPLTAEDRARVRAVLANPRIGLTGEEVLP